MRVSVLHRACCSEMLAFNLDIRISVSLLAGCWCRCAECSGRVGGLAREDRDCQFANGRARIKVMCIGAHLQARHRAVDSRLRLLTRCGYAGWQLNFCSA
jgi:hypothetical protein